MGRTTAAKTSDKSKIKARRATNKVTAGHAPTTVLQSSKTPSSAATSNPASQPDPMQVAFLVKWFRSHQRVLPWRPSSGQWNPYATWISEIMLQQTQVAAVIPYFEKFIKRFPDVRALASASLDDVYALWAGLGYYSRARNLKAAAEKIVNDLNGHFPMTVQQWQDLPGIGPYTAGAIASIALNQPAAIVDGNVVRVFCRLHAKKGVSPKREEVWEWAKKNVNVAASKKLQPRDFNQAMMELGALICTPKNPKCMECPLHSSCRGKSNPALYPEAKKKTWKDIEENVICLLSGDTVMLMRSKSGQWRQGLWDLPNADRNKIKLQNNWIPLHSVKVKLIVTQHRITRTIETFEMATKHTAAISQVTRLIRKTSDQTEINFFPIDQLPPHGTGLKKSLQRALAVART